MPTSLYTFNNKSFVISKESSTQESMLLLHTARDWCYTILKSTFDNEFGNIVCSMSSHDATTSLLSHITDTDKWLTRLIEEKIWKLDVTMINFCSSYQISVRLSRLSKVCTNQNTLALNINKQIDVYNLTRYRSEPLTLSGIVW